MYIDKLIKREVITLLVSVSLLVIIFIGVTYAKFLSVDKGQDTVINMGDLNISFCKDTTCDSTYTNIGQVIGTKVENGVTVPASIYPFKNDGSYSNETPYIFKIENTGTLDSTVKIRLKEDATFTPSGDYSSYARLTSKYAGHLKVAIRKIILYEDTGYQIGDVDMNGIVNKKDANLILDSLPTFTDLQRRLADFNRDGTINTSDSSDIYDMVYNRGTSNAFEKIYTYTFSELEDGVIWKNEIIKSGDSVAYSLWLYLDETTPNDAQNTFFVGNIDVEGEFIPKNTIFCTTNTELTQGAEYVNGQYTYRYMQEGKSSSSGLAWQNITSDGWGVQLTDKASTDAVNSEVCTYINNKPIVSMSFMFDSSKATTLDVRKFDTSKVTNMSNMFAYSQATSLNVSNFNTSNVINMSGMFSSSQATTLDVSSFNTNRVTNMNGMFNDSTLLTTIYASDKFNTYNVMYSTDMFTGSTKLVGGAGTKYNSSYINITYARIDGGTSNPGYFTDIADKDIPAPNSFATDSWKTIIKAVRNNNISKYKVGDTRTIDMGTYGTHTLRIANTSTPSECSRAGFSQTACGFVLEFADIITEHKMNDTATNVGGWPATTMRTFVNNDIYNAIPSEIKNAIIDTTVVSGHGSTSGEENFTSTDKLYLLASGEIWSDWKTSSGAEYDTAKDLTRTLDYYKNIGVTTSNYSGAIKKSGTSVAWWWLRAAISNTTNSFLNVYSSGTYNYNYATNTHGVAPAFRLG